LDDGSGDALVLDVNVCETVVRDQFSEVGGYNVVANGKGTVVACAFEEGGDGWVCREGGDVELHDALRG
jgi:hypothetical protein